MTAKEISHLFGVEDGVLADHRRLASFSGTWILEIVAPPAGLDATGLPVLSHLFGIVTDQLWFRVDPKRSDVDWRANKDPKVSTIINARAALGQLIGHKAPARRLVSLVRKEMVRLAPAKSFSSLDRVSSGP
ncbi:hypothetical protein N7519_010036 [Penicillium mononematosum]|uniref:uncharacterized protein n=1 Tax=Penicillium mononematosum TaxID=268346 RepID=UPI00254982F6|nr:uncharacterized protein N7519_010036 [Penicillium mononematosum]KAJ6179575.1 hypothetical protein N7519_010036 [Penicillium mononematosum]